VAPAAIAHSSRGQFNVLDETVHLERGKTGAQDQAEAGVRGGENGS